MVNFDCPRSCFIQYGLCISEPLGRDNLEIYRMLIKVLPSAAYLRKIKVKIGGNQVVNIISDPLTLGLGSIFDKSW